LGIRIVVARSFARIHRQNLIAQGILPLLFDSVDDYEAAAVGDEWFIADLRGSIESGASSVPCRTGSGSTIELAIELSPRERELLLAGGLLGQLSSAASS
jgi:aconitate hydratase